MKNIGEAEQFEVDFKLIRKLEQRALDIQSRVVEGSGAILSSEKSNADLSPIEFTRHPKPEGTVVAFGGISVGFGMPVKEFFGTLSDLPLHKVFIKDFKQNWYQSGLLGCTDSRFQTVELMSKTLKRFKRPWTFVGASAGGFASIYFGQKLNADKIVSIGPQTLVNRKVFLRFAGVPPWIRDFDVNDPENDLLNCFEDQQECTSPVEIFYSAKEKVDTAQAARLEHIKGVRLFPVDTKTHNTAKYLRDAGILPSIISGEFQVKFKGDKNVRL